MSTADGGQSDQNGYGRRSAIYRLPLANELPSSRGFIAADGSVRRVRCHAELPEAAWPRRTGIRFVREGRTLHLECRSVPTAAQLHTIAQEPADTLDFEVASPTILGFAVHGELPMAEVDELEDAVRAVFARWGIAT